MIMSHRTPMRRKSTVLNNAVKTNVGNFADQITPAGKLVCWVDTDQTRTMRFEGFELYKVAQNKLDLFSNPIFLVPDENCDLKKKAQCKVQIIAF